MARAATPTPFGQGDLFLPGGYDRDAVDFERYSEKILRRKYHEAECLGKPEIYDNERARVIDARNRVEWARAQFGSYTNYRHEVITNGLGDDGRYNPRLNGTAAWLRRVEGQMGKNRRRSFALH